MLLAALLWAAALHAQAADLTDLSGRSRSLEEHRGRIVVLNYWATWCIPCREEMPLLADLHDQRAGEGVVVVGASADEAHRHEQVSKFVADEGIDFPIWLGATTADMQEMGLGDQLPATAILDRDGAIVFRMLGPLPAAPAAAREILDERIDWLLSDRSTAPPQTTLRLHGVKDEPAEAHDHEQGDDQDHPRRKKGEASLVPS